MILFFGPLVIYKFTLGITGRLNGAGAEFWGQTGPHAGPGGMHHQNKMPVGPNTAGWEEPSPPTQRRNMPNYDDGTSLWGNPQQGKRIKTDVLNIHLLIYKVL